MHKKISKATSCLLAGALCVTSALAVGSPAHASPTDGFITEKRGAGLAVTGITDEAVKDGSVTIPDEIGGTPVTFLGKSEDTLTFLGNYPVSNLILGKNVSGATGYAFYGANHLESIELQPENTSWLKADGNVLMSENPDRPILIKYCPAVQKQDYTVPEPLTEVWNMDHADFGTLDLNNVNTMLKMSLAGTEIETLKLGDVEVDQGEPDEILYGAIVNEFDASESNMYESDGKALWKGDKLIKVAAGAEFEDGYFSRFHKASPYAFNSVPEYLAIADSLPESATKNVVFSFFSQDAGVFVVNGEVSFCYNYDKKVPTSVGGVEEYSPNIDQEKYDQIRALMYVGVPFNGTGLFEETFGVTYEEAKQDPEVQIHGDVALNIVSALVYDIIDGKMPSIINGIGYGPFTAEAVQEYKAALQEAVEHYEQYNFTPSFALEDSKIRFHRDGNQYASDPIVVNTLDGTGQVSENYLYTINIDTDGITVKNSGKTSFQTGQEVVLVSDTKPTEATIQFSYNEPTLKYYRQTSNDVQNVLASAVRQKTLDLKAEVLVDDFVISKQDITTKEELPGAKLTLTYEDGAVVDEWISTKEPHVITNPKDGTYTLTEVTAPEGYELAESITFLVKDGKVEGGHIIMYDAPIKGSASIVKTDAATGEELEGAKLELRKENGELVDSWISTTSAHIIENLEDGMYTLTEITAPHGYEIAESITFEVKNGEVVGGQIVMEDRPTESTSSEPDKPSTPSEPDKPDKPSTPSEPDEPDKPSTPSEPDKPGGNGGHSGGGGGGGHSSGGGGSSTKETPQKPTEEQPTIVKPIEEQPTPILPKTGNVAAASILTFASLMTLIILYKRKKQ